MPATTAEKAASPAPAFESWGRYPKYGGNVIPLNWQSDFSALAPRLHSSALPVGMGRSYGDVCLLKDGNLLLTTGMNRLIDFDPETGVLTAESGITLAQILDFAVPRGFFLPVTPGTKYVTLGGAIANDIHGKNHEVAGSFGNHVPCFELVRSDGSRRLCSPTENPDWFAATIGGMGLTGLITWAQLRLKPIVSRMIDYEGIQFHGIDEFLGAEGAVQARRVHRLLGGLRVDRKELCPRRLHGRRSLEGAGCVDDDAGAEACAAVRSSRLPAEQRDCLHVQHSLLSQADQGARQDFAGL